MKVKNKTLRLYAVTDRDLCGKATFFQSLEAALKGGATCVQLREKGVSDEEYTVLAAKAKALCRKYRVPLIVNDNVEVAVRSGADGIHVGQNDMKACEVRKLIGSSMILGVTAKTVEQALDAERNGADYLGCGAVFPSPTKPGAIPLLKETLSDICRAVKIPVCAIGGINCSNMAGLSGSGIAGVAVVSGVFAAENIEENSRKMLELSERLFGGEKKCL